MGPIAAVPAGIRDPSLSARRPLFPDPSAADLQSPTGFGVLTRGTTRSSTPAILSQAGPFLHGVQRIALSGYEARIQRPFAQNLADIHSSPNLNSAFVDHPRGWRSRHRERCRMVRIQLFWLFTIV